MFQIILNDDQLCLKPLCEHQISKRHFWHRICIWYFRMQNAIYFLCEKGNEFRYIKGLLEIHRKLFIHLLKKHFYKHFCIIHLIWRTYCNAIWYHVGQVDADFFKFHLGEKNYDFWAYHICNRIQGTCSNVFSAQLHPVKSREIRGSWRLLKYENNILYLISASHIEL